MALQLRRGTNAERLAMTPVNGELIYVTDYELVSTSVTSINTTTDTLTTTAAHGLSVNQQVKYIGATLNGLTKDQVYFVLTAPTITTFTLSTTLAGSTLDITGSFTVDLVFAKTPTTAAGVPLGEGVAILWIGDGVTVGGVNAASLTLDDLVDVVITDPVNEGQFLVYDGTNWVNDNETSVDTKIETLSLTRRSDSVGESYENEVAFRLQDRLIDTRSYLTDEGGPAIEYSRSSGTTEISKTYVSGGAIGAFTVTLNNVTGLVVGDRIVGTGLTNSNGGVLITVIAGNQLTLNTAFTVQASGTYTVGSAIPFGHISMEWFGSTNDHRYKVSTTTDAFLENPANTYPGTDVLFEATRKYSKLNNGVVYVDATNNRVGINDTSPSFSLDVTGTANITSNLTVDTNTLFVDASNNRVGIRKTPDVELDVNGAVGISGTLNVDGGTLLVDATTNRVGINNGSPGYELQINSSTGPGVDDEVQFAMTNGERTALFSNNTNGDLFSFSYPAGTNRLQFNLTNAYFPSGNLGINNSSPSYALDVTGEVRLSGENLYMNQDNTDVDVTVHFNTGRRFKWDHDDQRFDMNGTLSVPSITTGTGQSLTIAPTSGQNFTLSTTTAADPVTIVRNTATTNAFTRALTLRVDSTGTPAVGFGSALDFEIETAPNVTKAAGFIEVEATNVTTGDETFRMNFGLMNDNNTYDSVATLTSLGDLQIDGDLTVSGANISTGVTNDEISVDLTTSVTNLPIAALTVKTTSTGTPAVGMGTAINFVGQTAASNFENAGFIAVAATDITSTSEDFRMRFGLMEAGGTYTTKMDLDSAGNLQIDGTLEVDGNQISSSSATAITLSGADVTVVGNLTVDGTTTLGSNTADEIIVNANNITFSFNDSATPRGILGTMSTGAADYWFIGGAETGGVSNAGYAMIATGDDGNDPIFARQYTGSPLSGTVAKELTLLDGSGNTSLAGDLTVKGNGYIYSSSGLALQLTGANTRAAGNLQIDGVLVCSSEEDVANGAAISLSVSSSYFSTGATGETATLGTPTGVNGQFKSLAMLADGGGDMVVTVSNAGWKSSGTGTITFNDIGDACNLQYIAGKWFAVGQNGVTFA